MYFVVEQNKTYTCVKIHFLLHMTQTYTCAKILIIAQYNYVLS